MPGKVLAQIEFIFAWIILIVGIIFLYKGINYQQGGVASFLIIGLVLIFISYLLIVSSFKKLLIIEASNANVSIDDIIAQLNQMMGKGQYNMRRRLLGFIILFIVLFIFSLVLILG